MLAKSCSNPGTQATYCKQPAGPAQYWSAPAAKAGSTHCITVQQHHGTSPRPNHRLNSAITAPQRQASESHATTRRLNYAKTHAHHTVFDVWSTRVRELKEFGEGTMLYFYFLRWMAIMFAVLGLVASTPQVRCR